MRKYLRTTIAISVLSFFICLGSGIWFNHKYNNAIKQYEITGKLFYKTDPSDKYYYNEEKRFLEEDLKYMNRSKTLRDVFFILYWIIPVISWLLFWTIRWINIDDKKTG